MEREPVEGPAGANGSTTAKHLVIHPIRRGAADRVKNSQVVTSVASANDTEFADISGRQFGGIGIGGPIKWNEAWAVGCRARTLRKVIRPQANLVFMIGLSYFRDSIRAAARLSMNSVGLC